MDVTQIGLLATVNSGLTAIIKWAYIYFKKAEWESIGPDLRDKYAKIISIIAGIIVSCYAGYIGIIQTDSPRAIAESVMEIVGIILGGGILYDKILKPLGIKKIDIILRGK